MDRIEAAIAPKFISGRSTLAVIDAQIDKDAKRCCLLSENSSGFTVYMDKGLLKAECNAITWAQRLKRVFNIGIQVCSRCDGPVRVITCIEGQDVIDGTDRCLPRHHEGAELMGRTVYKGIRTIKRIIAEVDLH